VIRDDYDPMAEAPYDDPVEHPIHYDRGECPHCGNPIETRFVIEDMPYFRGAAVKYAIRAGRKNPDKELEDILKAIQCLQFEAERIERLTDDA
jgi:uncharacterized protein (UPF0212 family)